MSKLTKPETLHESLHECFTGLQKEAGEFNKLAKKATYRAVAIGLWALKAQSLHRCATVAQRRDEGRFDGATADETFDAWLQSATESLISRRTAYNYLTAAQNAGLDHESTIEDVAKLERQDSLSGRRLTAHDLYLPPGTGTLQEDEEEPKPAAATRQHRPETAAQQAWFPFYEGLFSAATDEKDADLLYHLPLTTVDPEHEVSLTDLEQKLEIAHRRVRDVREERIAATRTGRGRRGSEVPAAGPIIEA